MSAIEQSPVDPAQQNQEFVAPSSTQAEASLKGQRDAGYEAQAQKTEAQRLSERLQPTVVAHQAEQQRPMADRMTSGHMDMIRSELIKEQNDRIDAARRESIQSVPPSAEAGNEESLAA